MNTEDHGLFMETAGIEPAECNARRQLPVPLRNREGTAVAYAVIDAVDERLLDFSWYLDSDGRSGGKRYARRNESKDGVCCGVYLHREVLGIDPVPGFVIDHVNGLTLDNRRANLRLVTVAENAQNRRRSYAGKTLSRHRGVTWNKEKRKWQAQATLNGRYKLIGRFVDEDEAGAAVAAWRREHMPFSVEDAVR